MAKSTRTTTAPKSATPPGSSQIDRRAQLARRYREMSAADIETLWNRVRNDLDGFRALLEDMQRLAGK